MTCNSVEQKADQKVSQMVYDLVAQTVSNLAVQKVYNWVAQKVDLKAYKLAGQLVYYSAFHLVVQMACC